MATKANVDLRGWVKQSTSPIYDGLYPSSVRNPTTAYFFGYPYVSLSSITIPSIEIADTSNEAPKALFVSASNVTSVGTRTKTSNAVNPYLDLEYRWTITNNDDSAVENLELILDPRTGNYINPYTDQISPEATFILREPGTYKVTLTARGMSSTFGTVIEQTRTETVTVTASTLSKVWYDGLSGNDANDGLDPWGFALTTASYTESTKELTQSGAFTSYVHDVSVPFTQRDNYIYITKAGVTGLYKIASKTSNDTIVLADGLGSDQTNVTSSDGAKQTYTGGGTSGEESMLKDGADYNFSSSFAWNGKANPLALTGYGGKPTVYTTGSSYLFDIATNSGGSTPAYIRASNILFDPQNGAGTSPAGSIGGVMTASADTGARTIILDNITAQNGNVDTEVSLQSNQTAVKPHILFYNIYVDGRYGSTGRGTSRQGIYTYVAATGGYQRAFGSIIDNDADNSTLDHFWYPQGDMTHLHIAYCHTRNGTGNNYSYNIDHERGFDAQYLCVNNCLAGANSNWFVDASNGVSDEFDEYVVLNNKANVSQGMVFMPKIDSIRVAYNQYWGGVSGQGMIHHFGSSSVFTDAEMIVDNNQHYGASYFLNSFKDYPHEIVDNESWTTSADTTLRYDATQITAGEWAIEDNILYAPSKGDSNIVEEDSVDISVATLNGKAFATGNTDAQPSGWTDPANGDFGGVPTGLQVNL